MGDVVKIICAVFGAVCVIVLLLLFFMAFFVQHFGFPGFVEEYKILKQNYHESSQSESEDVFGQVVEMNKQIMKLKMYNKWPIVELTIPDGIDDMEPIRVR